MTPLQVDVNATVLSHGTTYSPLMLAVKYKQDEMVRHLLMVRGINLAFRNSRLQSPVLFAVQNNDIDLVNLLLSAEGSSNNNQMTSRRDRLRNAHHPCAMLETIKHGEFYACFVFKTKPIDKTVTLQVAMKKHINTDVPYLKCNKAIVRSVN